MWSWYSPDICCNNRLSHWLYITLSDCMANMCSFFAPKLQTWAILYFFLPKKPFANFCTRVPVWSRALARARPLSVTERGRARTRPCRCGAHRRSSTSPLPRAQWSEKAACTSKAGKKHGGARLKSVHPSMGKNSQIPRLPLRNTAVRVRVSRGKGEIPRCQLSGHVWLEQLYKLLQSVRLKVSEWS